jgi:hypothetical protein
VMDAIALFKNESLRSQDAVLEEKLAERMAVEKKELERNRDKRIRDLQNKISDLELDATKAKKRREEDDLARKDAERTHLQMSNRIVYLEAGVKQALEKHHLSDDEWRKKARARDVAHLEETRRLRGALEAATSRIRRAEQPAEGVRVIKRLRDPSNSGDRGSHDGRSHSSEDRVHSEKGGGGRDKEPHSARKVPVNVLKEPAPNDAFTNTTGAKRGGEKGDRSQKGEEEGTKPPGSSEDRERTRQHKRAPLGGEEDSQERSRNWGQEPMQLTQLPVPPARARIEKPWAEDDKQAERDEVSIDTAPTGVVDLSNTSFTSLEAVGAATTQGDGEGEVDYELSEEERVKRRRCNQRKCTQRKWRG